MKGQEHSDAVPPGNSYQRLEKLGFVGQFQADNIDATRVQNGFDRGPSRGLRHFLGAAFRFLSKRKNNRYIAQNFSQELSCSNQASRR
jgi:hypothetical protein